MASVRGSSSRRSATDKVTNALRSDQRTTTDPNMRPYCIFVACLMLFAFCSLARSEFSQGPDKCCFSFSNIKIPVKQVESYHTAHLECHRSGVIVFTKAQREICVDPTERWVQRLINLVDNQNMKEMSQSSSGESE